MTSTSCGSTASTQKSVKSEEQRSKSCATTCSSNSSCFLQRRKPVNPLSFSFKPVKTNPNVIKQRVLSAKLLKLRSIQNKLNDANFHLAELSRENQVLKAVQKRQEKSLSKYENTSADLPRLLRSHEEELRALTERNKTLRRTVKDLNDQIKIKDEELLKAQEKLNHLEKLNKDKHLTEREKLLDQLEDLKTKLQKADEQIVILNRKLALESKASKQRLNAEIAKHKQCQKDLLQAFGEIDRLTGLLETKENVVYPRKDRLNKFQRQSISMVTLGAANGTSHPEKLAAIRDIKNTLKTPITDVKLEPIPNSVKDEHKKQNDVLSLPSENIKNRLSLTSAQSKESDDCFSLSNIKEKGSSEVSLESREPSASSVHKSRPPSSVKLEKLSHIPEKHPKPDSAVDERVNRFISDFFDKSDENEDDIDIKREDSAEKLKAFDAAIQKATEDTQIEFDKKLGDYCSEIVNNVKNCSKVIETHQENLEMSRLDTDNIMETFQKTEKIEKKLKKSFFSIEEQDMDFIKEILTEEHKFQQPEVSKKPSSSGMEPKVKNEDKKKLLATLRAIDNGDSIDSINSPTPERRQSNIMAEILGNAR